jgi:hypothetical protein
VCGVPPDGGANVCYTPPPPPDGTKFGACQTTADCGGIPNATCKTQGDDGTRFIHGICTLQCDSQTPCPTSTECVSNAVSGKVVDGMTSPTCAKRCTPNDWASSTDANTCDDGLYCLATSKTQGYCVPLTAPPADLLGAACGGDPMKCRFPPTNGVCVVGLFDDQSAGFCSADCTFNDACGEGGICEDFNSGGVRLCLQTCTTPGAGKGECSTNLTCASVDGGSPTKGGCVPDCMSKACTGSQHCNTTTGLCE